MMGVFEIRNNEKKLKQHDEPDDVDTDVVG